MRPEDKQSLPRVCSVLAALWLAGLAGCSDDPACIEESGVACVWAGQTGRLGFDGDGNHRLDSTFYWPVDLSFSPDGTPYILDWNNHAVRRVNPDQTLETVVGNGFVGDGPADMSDLTAPGAPGTEVALNHPTDIVFQDDRTMLLMSWHNHKLRSVDVATGMVTVLCGRGAGFAGDGGPATEALLNQPNALDIDTDGTLYIVDQRNFRVRRIAPGDEHIIDTVVGIGTPGDSGDGAAPADAELRFEGGGNPEPSGAIAIGPDGALYIADSLNHRIRRADLAANIIETVAGTGTAGSSGDGGPATSAQIDNPRDLEFGPDGRLYIADTENHRIRVVDIGTGIIETVAGTGTQGESGEGLPATEIQLSRPFGIEFDGDGNLYIADMFNSRILKVSR